jgi:hypothetical protein
MSKLTTIAGAAAITVALALPAAAAAKTPARCHVPNLKGDTLAQARQKLTKAHCAAGKITRPKTTTGALTVSGQSPKAGRKMKHDGRVNLTLRAKTAISTTTTTSTPAPAVSYSAKVDPSFTQSATNPLAVTYSYSADATETQDGQATDLAQTDQLPAGVLNFFNGGQLACSMNVGGATSSGACPVTYPSTGTYSVTTQYIPSGTAAVTETDQETISPEPTSTILAVVFGSPQSETGPPPTYLESTNWFDGIDASYSETAASSFTLTLTDQTSGATQAGTSIPSNGCALEFVQLVDSPVITINPGCGLPGFSFPETDTVSITATTPTSGGFLGSTSGPTQIWAG